jgi:hypothetical protein
MVMKYWRQEGCYQALVAVFPAEVYDREVIRDDGRFPRYHQRAEEEEEEEVLAWEVEHRKGIGRKRAGDKLAERDNK